MQISAEPIPSTWFKTSYHKELQNSYKTGKFGNWMKPGVRRYVKENSTEYKYRSDNNLLEIANYQWTDNELKILGVNNNVY